jgi:putative ABC transport system permease protein
MPPRFVWNDGELWLPATFVGGGTAGEPPRFEVYGRLKPGITIEQAEAEIGALGKHFAAPYPKDFPPDLALGVVSLAELLRQSIRPWFVLLGAVSFLLLIACVNVANLLLARAESRQREIAVRTAIGASTWRLLRQFIAEGILLSLLGAVLGLGLAFAGLYTIRLTNAGSIPRAGEIGIDATVLLITLLVSIVTGVIFGLAPLLHLAVKNVHGLLKDAAGSASGSATAQNFRRALVAFEIGSAMLLLICCGLMVRAFWKLQEVDIGLNPHGVATMRVTLPSAVYSDNQKIESLWLRLQERVTRLPGVESAALVSGLPPQRRVNANDTEIEGFVPKPGGPIQNVDFYQSVSEGYFGTMGIRLIEGRFFTASDAGGAPNVAIVNQTMARMFWGNDSALGHRVRPSGGNTQEWCTVVGVVADVKNAGIDKPTGALWRGPCRHVRDPAREEQFAEPGRCGAPRIERP